MYCILRVLYNTVISTDILHGGCNKIFCNYYSKEDKNTKLEYVVSLYRESDEVKVIKFLEIINLSWPKIYSFLYTVLIV
jgi:hypothetical protein